MTTTSGTTAAATSIRRLATLDDAAIAALAAVTIDCVEGDASVGFMHPLTFERALAFWRHVADGVAANERIVFVAEDTNGICGTVQLVLAPMENQPHRADVSKLLVHRRARRRGTGEALMRGVEHHAGTLGRTVLVLDTASDAAERLYARLGWERVGVIPGYALLPRGGLCATTLYYRTLGDGDAP